MEAIVYFLMLQKYINPNQTIQKQNHIRYV